MAPSIVFYNNFKELQLAGATPVDLANDTIKVMLVTASYTPDIDADDMIEDADANEVSSSGYTAGGATLTTPVVSQDNTNDRAKFVADTVTWTSVTFTTRYAVIYKDSGVASTSPVIAYVDFESAQSPDAQDFVIDWHADGIFLLS
jgi:hypothetical protein